MTRAERYAQIAALRAQGLTFREIGAQLGLSAKTVHDVYSDPSGDAARARKARRSAPCVDCGRTVHNGGSEPPKRCAACARAHAATLERRRAAARGGEQVYSDDVMIAALRRCAAGGKLTRGDYDARRRPADPASATVITRFGLWSHALLAAGVERTARRGPRSDRAPLVVIYDALRACADDLGHPPTCAGYAAWRRAHPTAPSAALIRLRHGGGWLPALEAAGLIDPPDQEAHAA